MLELDVIDQNKQVVGKRELPEIIFSAELKEHLIHDVVVMQLANRRRGTASTKTRSQVSGSNNKPWRQKGTGRARAGTLKSPLWKGGGIIFGPLPRDYSYRLPKKARMIALRSVLAMKYRENSFMLLNNLVIEQPKTKEVVGLIKTLGLSSKILFVVPEKDENLERASRNIPDVKVLSVTGLNVFDILKYDNLVCTEEALRRIEERLLS
ncbi:MAG: 50S ribosomal protein L4 [Candidatus Tectomicrobia bacterium]|uniref:Large ribosomal subunit protein uL4 n=1 Tax=Tectimicrobiota bacterium TaxID=2528274 RepID=A0A933LQW9_UNCTE|nr:50S ribosomal protein L4 [Candidatus Tectomicrobia bacterium]